MDKILYFSSKLLSVIYSGLTLGVATSNFTLNIGYLIDTVHIAMLFISQSLSASKLLATESVLRGRITTLHKEHQQLHYKITYTLLCYRLSFENTPDFQQLSGFLHFNTKQYISEVDPPSFRQTTFANSWLFDCRCSKVCLGVLIPIIFPD